MQKPTHVLELNGRRYDAMTGRLISGSPVQSVDGFLQPTRQMHKPSGVASPATTAAPALPRHVAPPAKTMDIQRMPAHHAARHQTQHSKTLVRQAVSHPASPWKRHAHAASHTGALVGKIQYDIVPKHSAKVVDQERLHRAKKIARSGLVRRFTMQTPAPRLMAPTPTYEPRRTPAPAVRSTPNVKQEDIFERALAAAFATDHQAAPAKVRKSHTHRLRQLTSIAASGLAIFLILGFVAYQNASTIQLRLAASRAGVNATLPTWQPTGFHLGTFAYGPGTVTVKYDNSSSDQHFNIVQTASNWNSSSLLSDFVYPNNNSYDTVLSNGTTIYTYGKNNATWVNGGIWYRLVSDGSLNTNQIVNIATSM